MVKVASEFSVLQFPKIFFFSKFGSTEFEFSRFDEK